MTNRNSLWGGLIIILLFGINCSLAVIGYFAGAKPLYAVCQRPLHKSVYFALQSAKGQTMATGCPRFGLRYVVDGNATPLWTTDFSDAKTVPAKQAFYLEGSQIMECCATPILRGEQSIVCEMQFDRCQPTLVSLAYVQEVQRDQVKYGGRIIRYEDALATLQHQMRR